MGYVIGTDVGGTHTDIVASDGHGIKVSKVPSIPSNPLEAILNGLTLIARDYGITLHELLSNCDRFLHGSTIATNVFVQRALPKVGLLTTKGHRDSLWVRDGYKLDRWNLRMGPPWSPVPRHLRLGVEERLNYKGEELKPLNEGDVYDATRKFRDEAVQAVAISFLWSFLNPSHERRAKEIVETELPDIPVVISYDVLPAIREWERTFCTVLCAAIAKETGAYLWDLRQNLMKLGLKHEPLIIQANAGYSTAEILMKRPLYLIGSGPAGGALAGILYGERCGATDIITMDTGGTSCDVCILQDRRIPITKLRRLENEPIAVPSADIHTIGAGGGSIAWIDPGGALQVGPRSAGAEPGPACYGKGGENPTVTDAYLVLGYLDPDFFLGGRVELYTKLAEKAIVEKIAKPLGLDIVDAASRIVDILSNRMASAVRLISVQRGIDPTPFTLVVGGGAGPVQAGKVAEMVGIQRVVVPRHPGGFCALGQIWGNLMLEVVAPYSTDASKADVDKLTKLYREMEKQGEKDLVAEGITKARIKMRRFIDARYVGQVYEVESNVPHVDSYEPEHIQQIVDQFEKEHYRLYRYVMPGFPVQFVSCRVEAIGEVPPIEFRELPYGGINASVALKTTRRIYSPQRKDFVKVEVYDGDKLQHGNIVDGLAVIETEGSTLVVWENQRLTVERYGDFAIAIPRGI